MAGVERAGGGGGGSRLSFLPRGGPAVTMLVVMAASISAVFYSHYAQVRDKAVMRAGVDRDKERLKVTRQRQREQQQQQQDQQQ